MAKVLMYVMARADSSRLQNKVLFDLGGKPAFVHVIERALEGCPNPDAICVVTPKEAVNDPIETIARMYGYDVFRMPQHGTHESLCVQQHYGLTGEDAYIALSSDAPLHYARYLGYAVESLFRHNANVVHPVFFLGTLGPAVHLFPVIRGHVYKMLIATTHTVESSGTTYGSRSHYGKTVLLELPAYLQRPWPWGRATLDWPLQGVALKTIYEQLYRGHPIDLRDLYDLYVREPMLAALVPPDAPAANQPSFPQGTVGIMEQTIMNTCEHVWDRFEEVENEIGSEGSTRKDEEKNYERGEK